MFKKTLVTLIVGVAVVSLSASPTAAGIVVGGVGSEPDPSYNGNAMQVWLRGDSGITTVGGKVSDWQDKSNNNNDVTQANTDIQPTHLTSLGKQAVNFGGTEAERMFFGTNFQSTFQGSFTAFYLVAPTDGHISGDGVMFGTVGSDGTSRMVFGMDNNVSMNHLYKAGGDSANTSIAPMPWPDGAQSEYTLISYVVTAGGMHYAYKNGDPTPVASVDGSGVTNANFLLSGTDTNCWLGLANNGDGGSWPGSTSRFKGDIAEFMIYQGALSTTDRELVEDYLLGIPEPATLAVLGIGALGFLVSRRRR